MTNDEKWQQHYDEMMNYMRENHRRPSKHRPKDLAMHDWFKHNKRMARRGKMRPERVEKFKVLMDMANKLRRINQFDIKDNIE